MLLETRRKPPLLLDDLGCIWLERYRGADFLADRRLLQDGNVSIALTKGDCLWLLDYSRWLEGSLTAASPAIPPPTMMILSPILENTTI